MIQPDQSNYRYIKPVAAPEGGVRLVLPGGRALRMTSQQKRVRVPLKEPNAFVSHEVIDYTSVAVVREREVK